MSQPTIDPPPGQTKCQRCEDLEACLIKARRTIRNLRQIDVEQSRELGELHLAAGTDRRWAG